MDAAGHIALRPATRADFDLIRRWLARPDIQDWWGPVSATEAEVNMALSSGHAICRVIEVDGVAVGYAHAVDATLWGENLPDELEPGTWDLDLFIAAEAGATAVIQPGGSMRDEDVIRAADEKGLAMVLTGMRHFRH